MPYIKTVTNSSISKEQENEIKTRIGNAISLLGKSENWLMVDFEENAHLYFKGSNDNLIAYVEVKLFGSASSDSCNNMTKEISNIINEVLGIDVSNIYVSYYPTDKWGWNGNNF